MSRLLLLTMLLSLVLASSALAAVRYERADEEEQFNLRLNLRAPRATSRLDLNDRPGYRVFIPRGLSGREYYSTPRAGVRIDTPDRFRRQHRGPYDPRYYHRPGAYTILQAPGSSFYHGPGYSPYGAPVHVYPNGGTIVIDGSPVQRGYAPPQQYNDNRVYDYSTSVYDNSQTIYNAPQQSAPAPPQAAPVGPQLPNGDVLQDGEMRSYGGRFYELARMNTPEGQWTLTLEDGALQAELDGQRTEVGAADTAFGGFGFYEPGVGLSVIFRRGDDIVLAYPADGKWWEERLPYRIAAGTQPSVSMSGSEPWVSFTDVDGTRWVIALRGRQWVEIGSGTRP